MLFKEKTQGDIMLERNITANHSNTRNNLRLHIESKHKSKFEDLKKNMEIIIVCQKKINAN